MIRRLRRFLAMLALPYFRLELPGWQRLSSPIGLPIGNEKLWEDVAPRIIRSKDHRMRMKLHLQDWAERLTYFLGRHFDRQLELVLRAVLRRGDTFVDVGGNIGLVTLAAAAKVGPAGKVHTFEPNPGMVARIREMAELNSLGHVEVHPVGLSDREEVLMLTTVVQSSGWSTFARAGEHRSDLDYREVPARVVCGDDALGGIEGPLTLKIDVEGYELRVLRGLERLIRRLRPAIIMEVAPDLLLAAGATPEDVFSAMQTHGYRGYELNIDERFARATLRLLPIDPTRRQPRDVLWVHPESVHASRIVHPPGHQNADSR